MNRRSWSSGWRVCAAVLTVVSWVGCAPDVRAPTGRTTLGKAEAAPPGSSTPEPSAPEPSAPAPSAPKPTAPPLAVPFSSLSSAEVASRIDEIFASVDAMRFQVVQKASLEGHPPFPPSDGVLLIKKPASFSLTYTGDPPERLVSNGEVASGYKPKGQQFIRSPALNQFLPNVLTFVFEGRLSDDFHFELSNEAEWTTGPLLVATRKVSHDRFDRFMFYVDGARLGAGTIDCVRKVRGVGRGRDIAFELSKPEVLDAIDDAEFRLVAPEGATIIDLTK